MRKLIALLVLLLPVVAWAVDTRITCTPPVANTDGTPITTEQGPLKFNLYGGLKGATKTKLAPDSATCSFTRTNVVAGTHEYQATATNIFGVESAMSSTLTVLVAPTPGAPTNLQATVTTAWEMRGTAEAGTLRMVQVGYVEPGTACLSTQARVGGVTYQQVEKRLVDAYNKLEKSPPVTWTRCG
jgi:hypothetical protein